MQAEIGSPHSNIPERSASASQAWHSLLSGRYRLAGWHDQDGRRFIRVRRNETGAVNLGSRERSALLKRAQGDSLKVIALDLGVSISTAARDVALAMQRLGIQSEADLVAVLGHGLR